MRYFRFNPLALRALPLYSLTETQGERRVNSITSIVGIFNPSPRRYTPQLSPIFFCATHRNASGHGKGRRLNTNDFLSLQKIVSVALDSLYLFILLSSEKNEPRSAAAVIGPFGLSLRSPSGGCGTRSAQTVLALFLPSPLRLRRPIKAESGIVLLLVF